MPFVSEFPLSIKILCIACGLERPHVFVVRPQSWNGSSFRDRPSDYAVYECQYCKMQRIWPMPTLEALRAFYSSKRRDEPLVTGVRLVANRMWNYYNKYRFLTRFVHSGLVVDVGCGQGYFLETARLAKALGNLGLRFIGTEYDTTAVERLRRRGFDIRIGDIWEVGLEPRSVACFYLCHVLEHLYDPVKSLREMKLLLSNGGYVIIHVPSPDTRPARSQGLKWIMYRLPEHLWFFRDRSAVMLFERLGFRVKYIRETWPINPSHEIRVAAQLVK